MLSEKMPKGIKLVPVIVMDSSRECTAGVAAVKYWTSKEAFQRGFAKAAKIVALLIGASLPFAFIEPFAFMVWGSITCLGAFLILGPYFHFKYWSERVSFFHVEAKCPYCSYNGKLNPYLSTAFEGEFTVICKSCGQTARVSSNSK